MTLSPENKAVITKAAGLIRDNFTTGDYVKIDNHGRKRMCMVGALAVASNEHLRYDMTYILLSLKEILVEVAAALPTCACWGQVGAHPFHQVYHYNDRHCDGGEEAARILMKAVENG